MACFILMHGAFHGGWIWARVAARLRAAGHEVLTPTLTGCGDRIHLLSREIGLETHVCDLEATLVHEDVHDGILVGHSYGGTVATVVASRQAARLKALVYLDAQAPIDGQTASGAMGEATTAGLAALSDETWQLPPLPLDAVGVTAPADVAWVAPRRHPHPMRTLLEPVRLAGAPDGLARSYLECTQHAGLIALFGVDPLAGFAARAQAEGWRFARLDAPHDVMVTAPDLAAAALLAHA
ncbi:MAG: alpha/beta hydrolase [Deltaproteobacteria bacterium]|nr:alpha/beta hydrolase [Deltaproteobacteria bacterium]